MKHDDHARHLGAALIAAVRAMQPSSDQPPEWVALDAEAKRRGKSTRQFRAWCVSHCVEIRQENHRDAWVRPADVDRAVAGMPVAASPSRGDEIDQELHKVWPSGSPQPSTSRRARPRSA